jgi:hypothetical protein
MKQYLEYHSNITLLERLGNTDKGSKLEYLGHIMKNGTKYKLLKSILQGKVLAGRGTGSIST